MTANSEYDSIGELFRLRLEDHRIPVDEDGWDEIERCLGKRKKNKAIIWLWSAGAMAAAIAVLLIINHPSSKTNILAVSHQVSDPSKIVNNELLSTPGQESRDVAQVHVNKQTVLPDQGTIAIPLASNTDNHTGAEKHLLSLKQVEMEKTLTDNNDHIFVAIAENEPEPEKFEQPVTQVEKEISKLDASLVEDNPDEETPEKDHKKWLLAAAFGTGGYTDNFSDTYEEPEYYNSPVAGYSPSLSLDARNYATANIKSINEMARRDLTDLRHLPPLSFGMMVRKSLGKYGGVESGLVYTYLSSSFKWFGKDVDQNLHYLGIPLNMVVYLWQTNPNWRIYLSGGVTIEKGLRAIYSEERKSGNEIHIKKINSSIDGLQWSMNGALGINYRLSKGLGFYFEPRVGYSFDCNQPISIRTEWPIFIGMNLGLNYEF